ncbi:MAG: glutamate 5-kinase [Maricaulaceae bacterium]
MESLSSLSQTKRIVIKIGSAILVDHTTGELNRPWLDAMAKDIAALKRQNIDVVIVSSGAIALGRALLSLSATALSLPQKQACAATGQTVLTQAYARALNPFDIRTAQALLTLEDTEDRRRGLNARETLKTLLSLSIVPIINENDTVATDEIRYGDNDRLAARTAQMIDADTLILLSDIDGLYTADPRQNTSAKHLPIVEKLTPEIMAMGGGVNASAGVGSGGMATKLAAAEIATQAGCHMCIMNGEDTAPISRLQNGAKASWFLASDAPYNARRRWIQGALDLKGTLTIDAGAAKALSDGKSLLAAGVTHVSGHFEKGDAVSICGPNGNELARGLISYSAKDTAAIKGLKSGDIENCLGYNNGAALIHRDNLASLKS